MKILKIEIEGALVSDLTLALEVVLKNVTEGYVAGSDRNDTGNYKFSVLDIPTEIGGF